MSDFTHICWLDLETTGLEPNIGEILEIGAVLTDVELNVISERSWIVVPRTLDLLTLHPTVREMHYGNGLIADIVTLRQKQYPPLVYTDIASRAREVEEWLRYNVSDVEYGKTVALGGSGVSHFDLRWLQHHAPRLARLFYRSTVDVGVMRRFIETVAGRSGLVPPETRNLKHRALDDARQHLAEARVYRDLLRATNGERPRFPSMSPPVGR